MRFAEVDEICRLDLDHLRSLLSDRTRVVAFPWASNAVGTVTPVAEIAALAHEAGALAWVDAVHFGPHGPIDVQAVGADVLVCSPYKFYGPHLGLAFGRRELLESWRPYKVRPARRSRRHASRPARLRTSCSPASSPPSSYLAEVGWDFVERARARARLSGSSPDFPRLDAARRPDDGRPRADVRVTHETRLHRARSQRASASAASQSGTATTTRSRSCSRLGLPDGAVRIGIVHYNTADEVDRLLEALADL